MPLDAQQHAGKGKFALLARSCLPASSAMPKRLQETASVCGSVFQVWPDFLHEPNFPQSILQPGQLYRHIWSLRFYNSSSGVQTASIP
jgi:hypothetical protein